MISLQFYYNIVLCEKVKNNISNEMFVYFWKFRVSFEILLFSRIDETLKFTIKFAYNKICLRLKVTFIKNKFTNGPSGQPFEFSITWPLLTRI